MAHANYVKSNPASDARLAKSPTEVRVTFSETPDPAGSDLAVLDTAGKRLSAPTVAAATDEPNTLIVSVPDLPEGGYLVSWTARSAVDGHETKGAFGFAIGNAPLPSIPDIGPSAPPPAPLEIAEQRPADDDTAEEATRNVEHATVRAALEALPQAQRRTIELAYFGGYTHVELAQIMGVPLGTVKGRMRIGLQKLRRALERETGAEAMR